MTFDIRKFLTENKVTAASKQVEEGWGIDTDNYTGGVVVQPDYSRSYGPSEPSEAELERMAQEKRKEAEEKLKRDIPDIEDYVYAGLRDKVGAERIMGLVSAKFGPLAVEWLENSGLLDLKENKMSLVSIMKELMKKPTAGPNKPGRGKEEGLEEKKQAKLNPSAGKRADQVAQGAYDGRFKNKVIPDKKKQADKAWARR